MLTGFGCVATPWPGRVATLHCLPDPVYSDHATPAKGRYSWCTEEGVHTGAMGFVHRGWTLARPRRSVLYF